MLAQPKKFYIGLGLMVGFLVVLVFLFLPLFEQGNALDYLDDLYNSISKGSANYIEDLEKKVKPFADDDDIDATLTFDSEKQASEAAELFGKSEASVERDGAKLSVKGNLAKILQRSLEDAKLMFDNDGDAVKARYDTEIDEKRTLYNWWAALKSLTKDLRRQGSFDEANVVGKVTTKGVETAYNYYGIVPEPIGKKILIVILSLAFYVIYTMWYGFAILYMFEGWGLKLSH
jgi:hypothetical protein